MIIISFFTEAGTPKSGLSPTIDIVDIEADSLIVNSASMTALTTMTHAYYYDFTAYDDSKNYAITIDGGASLNNIDRYQFGGNENQGLNSLSTYVSTYLDIAVSSRSSHTAADVWTVATRTLTSFGTLITDIWSAVLENSKTALQMMRIMFAVLKGKSAGGGTNTLTFRDDADSKDRITATVDTTGNRTNIVVDGD